jgi:hypothetical protein
VVAWNARRNDVNAMRKLLISNYQQVSQARTSQTLHTALAASYPTILTEPQATLIALSRYSL